MKSKKRSAASVVAAGDQPSAFVSSGISPPVSLFTDDHRLRLVDIFLSYIGSVIKDRDPGMIELGQYAESFFSLIDLFAHARGRVLTVRFDVRNRISTHERNGETPPHDLLEFERALSMLEVVMHDVAAILRLKTRFDLRACEAATEVN